ncbi:MAG: acyl-CoA dehydrogenase family protein, partial [Pseudomonadota bacterium]
MDLSFSEKDEAFRQEVVAFLDQEWPEEKRGSTPFTRAAYLDWHKKLHAKGWAAPAWPVAHGGQDWTPTQHYIFNEEMA